MIPILGSSIGRQYRKGRVEDSNPLRYVNSGFSPAS
jgi:hypothetical protein